MAYLKLDSEIPVKGKGSKLSGKMLRFVEEYLVDLNGTQAILRVPYKTDNPNRLATELLRHPLVLREIEKRTEKRRERMEIKADYLINKLINIIEATEENNPQAALRAIELAGKSIALWKDRQEISGPDGAAIEMEQRIKEDVTDFTSKLARLAESTCAGGVVKLTKPGSIG